MDLVLYFSTYWYFKIMWGGSKIMFCFLVYHTFKFFYCKSPTWTPSSGESNASTFIIKNRNFWFGSYWEIGNNIFHHGRFVFFLCCYFEPRCPYLNLSIFLFARLNRWHEPRGAVRTAPNGSNSIWNVPYFQLQGWTSLYNFETREPAFFNGFLVVENNFLVVENQTCFFAIFFTDRRKVLTGGPLWPVWISCTFLARN